MTEMQFESRMSDSDALMWNIEKDPLLRSTITVVTLLDAEPDRDVLADRIERGSRLIPRMRQRVMVLDIAEPIAMQGFDRARPLWEFTVVDGVPDPDVLRECLQESFDELLKLA